jgi:hypothetical protein
MVDSTFDIFRVTSEGPLWVEASLGLREAKERVVLLGLTSPGEYFIHSQGEGVVVKTDREFPEEILLDEKCPSCAETKRTGPRVRL